MGDVVNLNRVRKTQARNEREAGAAVNRARFGRTKPERAADHAETAQRDALLDRTRRDKTGDDDA